MDDVQYKQIVKATKGERPSIFIPKKIMEILELDELYAKFTVYKNKSLRIEITDKLGIEKVDHIKQPDSFKQKIIENQNTLHSKQLETKKLIEEKFEEFGKKLEKIKTNSKQINNYHPLSRNREDEEEEEEIELIDMESKHFMEYKYIYRYFEQDQEQYKNIREMMGKGEDLKADTPTIYYGVKFILDHGLPSVFLDSPCDWECDEKGKERIPILTYFEPHLHTYIVDENGVEQRVPYDDVRDHESEALFEFISIKGKKYQLNSKEMWFKPYGFESTTMTVEEILSKKTYQRYLDKEIYRDLSETIEFRRVVV